MATSSPAFLKNQPLGRILAGHPWIYESDVLKLEKPPKDGSEIIIRTANGGFVGTGFYNSKSKIPIRIFSRLKDQKLDASFFREKILAARRLREEISGSGKLPECCRLIWSEADFLPGLIVDKFGDVLVVQTLTLALDMRKEEITRALKDVFHPAAIMQRNDVGSREFEGLAQEKGWLDGDASRSPILKVRMGGIGMEVDVLEGQKTGAYLDQIPNHLAVARYAQGRRVLDCFTYHGGFALHAALGGAKSVEALDISGDALQRARRNAELNKVEKIQWVEANVFDALNSRVRGKQSYDLIVLYPPSFTKSRAKLQEALRGYKEIHLRALKLLNPGGLLATFCCSHHVDADTFRSVALDAAFDARRILRLRDVYLQSPDHPIIPAVPETEYLKGFLFEVVG
jgi:23S rRNA (cytosine1962-C5)-methyltransferase